MPLSLDKVLGVDAQALLLRSQRADVLASNLANADTPGYKARDINFSDALARATGAQADPAATLATPTPGQIGGGGSGGIAPADLLYRVPMQPSVDGNTVNAEVEQAAFMDNAVRYEAALTILNNRLQNLRLAIKGS